MMKQQDMLLEKTVLETQLISTNSFGDVYNVNKYSLIPQL
jgi:hypothetical protein